MEKHGFEVPRFSKVFVPCVLHIPEVDPVFRVFHEVEVFRDDRCLVCVWAFFRDCLYGVFPFIISVAAGLEVGV